MVETWKSEELAIVLILTHHMTFQKILSLGYLGLTSSKSQMRVDRLNSLLNSKSSPMVLRSTADVTLFSSRH